MDDRNFVFETRLAFDGWHVLNIHLNPVTPYGDRRVPHWWGRRPPSVRLLEDSTNAFPVCLREFRLKGQGNSHRTMCGIRLTIGQNRRAIRLRDHHTGMHWGRTRIRWRVPMRPFRRCFPIDMKLGGSGGHTHLFVLMQSPNFLTLFHGECGIGMKVHRIPPCQHNNLHNLLCQYT